MIRVILWLGLNIPLCHSAGHQQTINMAHPAALMAMGTQQGALFPSALPVQQQAVVPVTILGSSCSDNLTCSALPNSYCAANRTCQCMPNFIEDPMFPGTCKLAPGYNELCALGEMECRQPFVCNASNLCDCKPGYLQEYFQCVKDCPPEQVPVNDVCMSARQLEEKCEANEQCVQSYSQCLHNKCQCVSGTNPINANCYPVNQCPLGEPAKDKRGKVQTCTADNEEVCAKDSYCLYAEMGSASGFCCPKIKMNCPIGQPLDGHNCTNCPWDTHHCFSYVIGSYSETMCCPNACPSEHPIQKDGKCFAKVAYRGHCMIDEQCYTVLGASCRKDKDDKNKCMCPEGNFRNYYGRCLKEAGLGEDCTANEECRQGTNSLCSNGVCTCFSGYIPEPNRGSPSVSHTSQRCIAEPSCPTPAGLKRMESYTDCADDKSCKENEFCRRWWNEANHTFSLCCPKPKFSDYEAMCKPFRMKLLILPKKTEPMRCDISSMPHNQFYSPTNDASDNVTSPVFCPAGSSCLFDPYSPDKGVCCKPDDTAPMAPIGTVPASAPVPGLGSLRTVSQMSPTLAPTGGQIPVTVPAAVSARNHSGSEASNGLPALTTPVTLTPQSSSTFSIIRPVPIKSVGQNGPADVSTTPNSEDIDEEELETERPELSTIPPAPSTTNIPRSTHANAPHRSPGANLNIPVVRIRGFNNNNNNN